MKKIAFLFAVAVLASICLVSYAQEKAVASAKGTKIVTVPKGKTYIKLDARRKEIGRYGAGQQMGITVNCVIVDCPSTFPKDTVCWHCSADTKAAAAKAKP
jgi:hypothetical protein